MALNLAISDRDALDYLYLPTSAADGALNYFGEARDLHHNQFVAGFK